ncbi:hypothetical protein EJ06DRAFT_278347 [Trichodelitschia bisporula]|uniref:Uncharacterized protein n=1 Tax=Trichodelitschia bisporula TaxID=703511 RepID=A0A6G1I5J1_9PEZI|nr:hypothetical protein EJ06DRAFT_278347 [Trichodelitschia bisporula]
MVDRLLYLLHVVGALALQRNRIESCFMRLSNQSLHHRRMKTTLPTGKWGQVPAIFSISSKFPPFTTFSLDLIPPSSLPLGPAYFSSPSARPSRRYPSLPTAYPVTRLSASPHGHATHSRSHDI